MNLSKFERETLTYFMHVGFGSRQFFNEVLRCSDLGKYWFLETRLKRLVKRGFLVELKSESTKIPNAYGLSKDGFRIINIDKAIRQLDHELKHGLPKTVTE